MINYEPDILAKGLDVIFCGLNPALSAAVAGHNFSNRNNRFWPVLHLAGFTDVRLQPQDERRLLEYGCGITAIVRRPTNRAEEVSPEVAFLAAHLPYPRSALRARHPAPVMVRNWPKRAASKHRRACPTRGGHASTPHVA